MATIYNRIENKLSQQNHWLHYSDIHEIVEKVERALESKMEIALTMSPRRVCREVRNTLRLMIRTKRAEYDLACIKGTIATWKGMENAHYAIQRKHHTHHSA
jgi:hypothetical protein